VDDKVISRFNIRVYGLFIHEGAVLITDEFRLGQYLTKFPGGGMQFGEGTLDCLRRECLEEMGQEVNILSHFYTTDFFQPTLFLPQTEQLLSIYYLAELSKPELLKTSVKPFDFERETEGAQRFRWIPLHQLDDDRLTLPVDKVVAKILRENMGMT
jgi:8-oxo-dGTP diphosphatase